MKILFVDETSQKNIMKNSSVDSSRLWNITNDWTTNSSNTSIAIPPQTSYPSDVPLAIFLWIIFIVGVTGNVFLVAINIWRRSSKQAATQFFMTSLAVSDLGLLFWATWINAVLAISPSFSFGRIVCKITNLWTSLAADSSIMILSVIGIDRYV